MKPENYCLFAVLCNLAETGHWGSCLWKVLGPFSIINVSIVCPILCLHCITLLKLSRQQSQSALNSRSDRLIRVCSNNVKQSELPIYMSCVLKSEAVLMNCRSDSYTSSSCSASSPCSQPIWALLLTSLKLLGNDSGYATPFTSVGQQRYVLLFFAFTC